MIGNKNEKLKPKQLNSWTQVPMMLIVVDRAYERESTQTAPLTMRGGWVYSIGLISDEKNGELFVAT